MRLAPRLDDHGFHYGADVALPDATRKITLAIGAVTMPVAGAAKGKFKTPVTAAFDWGHAGH
jgi:hypothetical protein